MKWTLKHKEHEEQKAGGRNEKQSNIILKSSRCIPCNSNSIPIDKDNQKKLVQWAPGVLDKNIYSMTAQVNKEETTQMFIRRRIMTSPYNEILSISENI